jgi:predicted transcriptional regulator
MELIWQQHEYMTAKQLSLIAADVIGWNKNTTYTILKKLIGKNAIERIEPNFICKPLITRESVQIDETRKLIDKLYDGSLKTFFASFIKKEHLSKEEVKELKDLINREL